LKASNLGKLMKSAGQAGGLARQNTRTRNMAESKRVVNFCLGFEVQIALCALRTYCQPRCRSFIDEMQLVLRRGIIPYRSGRSKTWLKVKNPAAPGVTRFEDRS
jgi:hypothetical protein